MRIVFSRKGFDSGSGGGPSPIVNGVPISLPIPAGVASSTSYADLGLAPYVAQASRGQLGGEDLCHHDPMFLDIGVCLFGQCGAAQTHLSNRGVDRGDVFVFFGLFAEEASKERHHRIFGMMTVEEVTRLDPAAPHAELVSHGHPHALAMHAANDTIYRGPFRLARSDRRELRLTVPGGPVSLWNVPPWLKRGGLSYHDRAERWLPGNRLQSVARGQEFVADVGNRAAPRAWLKQLERWLET